MILKSHTPIALYAMFKVSRRKPTLIIVTSQNELFVVKASILWNTYQTLPEGRDINRQLRILCERAKSLYTRSRTSRFF